MSMDTEILEDLGLTQSEIKTYVALLESGPNYSGIIIEETELQSSVVHRALLSLIKKGLVGYVQQGKHKTYQATEPEFLLQYVEAKKKKLERLLPELKKREMAQKQKTETSMYKTRKGISEVYYRLISQSRGEFLTFGGSRDTTSFMGITWWKNMYAKRIDAGLSQRHIASDEVLPYIGPFLKMKKTKIRFLPREAFSQYQETAIIGDFVAISIFADEGYSILIHNKEVAAGYKKNFEMMWKISKKKK